MTEDEALVRWLRVALTITREMTEILSANGRPDPLYRFDDGSSGPSLGPRMILDGVKADAALVAEHTTGNAPNCSRCVRSWDYEHDGCESCETEPHETPLPFTGVCPTLRFVATRYRHVIPGWRGEWAS